jgi:uncharacterized membrane protein
MDEMTKVINRPNDYINMNQVNAHLIDYPTTAYVEEMILNTRIDSKASKTQVNDLQSQVKQDFVRFEEKMKEMLAPKAYV